MATMKTLNGYGFNATEFNGKTSDSYLQKTDTASDSAKLGGKAPEYYIQPRNLLDNSDFTNPVNQRGMISIDTPYTYIIDRWFVENNTTARLENKMLYLTGTITQKVVFTNIAGKTLTYAACNANGSIIICTFNAPSTFDESWKTLGYTATDDGSVNIYTTDINDDPQRVIFALETNTEKAFLWAALYEGSYTADTLPPYVPKGYVAELAECQRYFRKSFVGSSIPSFSEHGQVIIRAANTNWLCSVNFDKPMRCAPSVIVYSPVSKQAGKISRFSDDTEIDVNVAATSSDFQITKASAFTDYDAYYFSYIASSDL